MDRCKRPHWWNICIITGMTRLLAKERTLPGVSFPREVRSTIDTAVVSPQTLIFSDAARSEFRDTLLNSNPVNSAGFFEKTLKCRARHVRRCLCKGGWHRLCNIVAGNERRHYFHDHSTFRLPE